VSSRTTSKSAGIFRWTARVWSLGSIGIILAFAIGESFNPTALSLKEALLFACFPAAVLAGLALSWKWPVAGGLLTILGLLGFYSLHRVLAGRFPSGFAFILIALPGWLFILSELLVPRAGTTHPTSETTPC
jgi:hypothetical protein